MDLRERLLQQAAERDTTITETLTSARQTIEPMIERSSAWRRLDPLKLIDQTIAVVSDQAVEGDRKWNAILAKVRPLTNVLNPLTSSAPHRGSWKTRRRVSKRVQSAILMATAMGTC